MFFSYVIKGKIAGPTFYFCRCKYTKCNCCIDK